MLPPQAYVRCFTLLNLRVGIKLPHMKHAKIHDPHLDSHQSPYGALVSYGVMMAIQASAAGRARGCVHVRVRAGRVWHFSLSGCERTGCVIEMSCIQERSLTERQPVAMPRRARHR